MRLGWVLLVGCARAPAAPVLEASAPRFASCEVARWRERASVPVRASISGNEVAVVDVHGDRVEVVAEVEPGLLVDGEVAEQGLDRVVTHEVEIAHGVVVQPGLLVDPTGAVETGVPIYANGSVPRSATGRYWQRRAPATAAPYALSHEAHVYDAPRLDAEGVAIVLDTYRVVDRLDDLGNGWLAIDAHTAAVRVHGFVHPIVHTTLHGTYDFSDDAIEGVLVVPPQPVRPRVEAGCLYQALDDHAAVVGVSDGSVRGTAVGNGWVEVRIAAPWGRVIGYGRASSER